MIKRKRHVSGFDRKGVLVLFMSRVSVIAILHLFPFRFLSEMANLSDLPYNMLAEIARRLEKLEDYISFRSVSKSLRAAAKDEYFEGLRLRQQTPYLMLSVRDDGNDDIREIYSLVEGESVISSVKVPKFKGKKCYESLGWLLCIEEDASMSLLDPFTGTEIPLPHQNTFPGYEWPLEMDPHVFIQKMVLSSRPSETPDFVLMVIADGGGNLAFWRPGDKAWNLIKDRIGTFRDVVYLGGGQFCAFGSPAMVWVFKFSECDKHVVDGRVVAYFMPKNLTPDYFKRGLFNELVHSNRKYIVKTIDGSLLLITRKAPDLSLDGLSYITNKFHVYEIDIVMGTWKEIYSLGSMAVFVGHNSTIAVDASRFPGTVIKANHIYFTDDDWEYYYFEGPKGGGMDNGIYNLETGTIEPVYRGEPLFSKASPSTWITPCF